MARAGRADQAREVLKGVIARASDLGLLSEEIDPASGELRGNIPQALSHLALVTAAYQLGSPGDRMPRRAPPPHHEAGPVHGD